LIRAPFVCALGLRALMASAVLAAMLALGGCYTQDGYNLPTQASKELSSEMLADLARKNMPKDSPILVRIFKEESELEVWKQDTSGRYALLKVYPICRWSGDLGPKVKDGDRQAPEGFYPITPGLMNPNSNYYLAINTGFPNAYDKANNRSVPRRPEGISDPGLSLPHDAGEHGPPPQQSKLRLLEDDQGRVRPFRSVASGTQDRRLRPPLCV
jgi:hypothetical protein